VLHKYATLEVLAARMGAIPADPGDSFRKSAKRWKPIYEPRPGYLYVRSRAISSRTNDNFDTFPAAEIAKAYRTFIGKPVFVNHHNADHRRARGVIIDAVLHEDVAPDGSEDTWVEVLMEIDAITFPNLAQAILKGRIDRTSMGTSVGLSECSFCGNQARSVVEFCKHIPAMKGQRITRVDPETGKRVSVLVHEICYELTFFENSLLVEDPADPTAYAWIDSTDGVAAHEATAGMLATASKASAAAWPEMPRTGAEAKGLRFEVYEGQRQTRGVNPPGVTWVYAYDAATDQMLGWLGFCNQVLRSGTSYEKPKGEIYDVYVEEAYRRQGVATRLLEKAREVEPSVHHSWNLSDDGKAWSEKVAAGWGVEGEVPKARLKDLSTPDLIAQYDLAISSYSGRVTNASPRQKRINHIVDLLSERADSGDAEAEAWFDHTASRKTAATSIVVSLLDEQGDSVALSPDLDADQVFLFGGHGEVRKVREFLTEHLGGTGWKDLGGEMVQTQVVSFRVQEGVHDLTDDFIDMIHSASLRTAAVPAGVTLRYDDFDKGLPRIRAELPDGRMIGTLSWFAKPGPYYAEVYNVSVDEPYRRQGIATAMWNLAKEHQPDLHHSQDLSDDGRAWSRTVAKVHVPNDPSRYGDTSIRYELGGNAVIDPATLPPVVYHVTTAGSQIGSVLAADYGKGGGLGGNSGEDRSVSFTTDRQVASDIAAGMAAMATAARRYVDGDDVIDTLAEMAIDEGWAWTEAETYRAHSDFTGAVNAWFFARQRLAGYRNPLFFGVDPERWATIRPSDIGVVTASREDIIASGAMVTDFDLGSKYGLEEIRVWGDVKVSGFVSYAMKREAADYWGGHRPIEDADPLHDLGSVGTFPPDVYEHPEWYSFGEHTSEAARVIRRVRGNPDAKVTIYRALPPGQTTINTGDWVTIARGYAEQHAMQSDDPAEDWPIIAAEVPAGTVRSGGSDILEWGYWGPSVNARTAALQRTAEADHKGVMIALVPSRAASEALLEASGGTEPLEDQHITLAYLGTLGEEVTDDDLTRDQVVNTAGGIATRYAGMNGEVSGWGVFNNEQDTLVALWSVPGINGLRQAIVEELRQIGIPVKSNYSFTPHQTMGYYEPGSAPNPEPLEPKVRSDFMHLLVSWGDEDIVFPLSGIRMEAQRTKTAGSESETAELVMTEDHIEYWVDVANGQADAELYGQNLGTCTFHMRGNVVHIGEIAVSAQRQGIGTHLMDAILWQTSADHIVHTPLTEDGHAFVDALIAADPQTHRLAKTASWGLTLEDYISVAEEAVERTHPIAASRFVLPDKSQFPKAYENPDYWAAMQTVQSLVEQILAGAGVSVHSGFKVTGDGWHVTQSGAQGMTDGYNWIDLRSPASLLTILHESAHVINATGEGEGEGHDKAFVHTFADLLGRHVAPAAKEQFLTLVGFHDELERQGSLRTQARILSGWRMMNVAAPEGYYLPQFVAEAETEEGLLVYQVQMKVGGPTGEVAGVLSWYDGVDPDFYGEYREPGEIADVTVFEPHRRKGIATALLAAARQIDPKVHHSWDLTDDGRAWMQAVGQQHTAARVRIDKEPERVMAPDFMHYKRIYAYEGRKRIGMISWYVLDDSMKELWVDDRPDEDEIEAMLLEAARLHEPGFHRYDDMDAAASLRTAARDESFLSSLTYETRWRMGREPSHNATSIWAFDAERNEIGSITWFDDDGEIGGVDVREPYRRRGLATELLRRAREINPSVRHSEMRTHDGDAWVAAVGSRKVAGLAWQRVRWGYIYGDLFLERAPGNQWNIYEHATLNEDGTVNYSYPDGCIEEGVRSLAEAKATAEALRREGSVR